MQHDYSGHDEIVPPEKLTQLNGLADQLDKVDREVVELEAKLKEREEARRILSEKDIPDLMLEIGLKSITTMSGLEIDLREEVRCSFPPKTKPEKRKEAYDWLINNHHEGLIKHNVEMKFPRGQRDQADKIVEILEHCGIPVNIEREDTVHHQTLLAFLRERIREGEEIPMETFGAWVQKFAKIKRSK